MDTILITNEFIANPIKLAKALPIIPYIGMSHQFNRAFVPKANIAKNG
jgi:hypothetical protein